MTIPDDRLGAFFQAWIAPLYVDRWVKLQRIPRGTVAGTTIVPDHDRHCLMLVSTAYHGKAFWEVLFHELAHLASGYYGEPEATVDSGLEMLAHNLGDPTDPALLAYGKATWHKEKEAILTDWAKKQAGIWWDAMHDARQSMRKWRVFLGVLEFMAQRRRYNESLRRMK